MDLNTGRTRPMRDEKPALSSATAGWDGFLLEESGPVELEANDICRLNHDVVLHLGAPVSLEWRSNGTSLSKSIPPGQISILPARVPFSVRVRTRGAAVVVSLEENFLLCAIAEIVGVQPINLLWVHGTDDPLIRELILALRSEAQAGGAAGKLYAESVATMLAVHLARQYSAEPLQVREYRSGLTKFQLRRVIDFVDAHLADDISLRTLAGLAGLSPFHFARMFKQSTGMAPHQYLIRSRVARARKLLLIRNATIADVAAQVGFCDQSHLAAHFKRVYGLTPMALVQRTGQRKNTL